MDRSPRRAYGVGDEAADRSSSALEPRSSARIGKTSPAVERALAILSFLAEHGDQGFSLSELSRRLGLAKATGHTILSTLLQNGFVSRNSAREYTLGPAVIPLGEAASSQNRALALALQVIPSLAEEMELACILTTVVDNDIRVVGKAGLDRERSELLLLYLSQRISLIPPIGAVFVAWWAPERIEKWLGSATGQWGEDRRSRFIAALATVRSRGYSVSAIEDDKLGRVRDLLSSVNPGSGEGDLFDVMSGFLDHARYSEGYAVAELLPKVRYNLSSVAAPIFDRSGRVILALTLKGFTRPLVREQIHDLGERLLKVTESVTSDIGGRRPEFPEVPGGPDFVKAPRRRSSRAR